MSAYLLHQLLTQGAAREHEREAVRCDGGASTYGELDQLSGRLACALGEMDVRRGDRVGIYLRKGIASVVALYGIMKAGAVYVPLDPLAPPARVAGVIADCGMRCLVTGEELRGPLARLLAEASSVECLVGAAPPDGGPRQLRSISWEDVSAAPPRAMDDGLTEQDPAYILYTSGSTGSPKGILHTHRSALSFVTWAKGEFGLSRHDRLGNHAPLHFDLSTFDLFAGAAAGATTVIIPEATAKLPAELSDLIAREALTVWYSVPFALTQLLTHGALDKRDLSQLRRVLFAGEAFPIKHLMALMAQLPWARFSNLYGPTETNVCTFHHVEPLAEGAHDSIPIGRACANTETLVVDPEDRAIAGGEPGELLVRGPSVMRCYWGRPDLSEQAFFRRPAQSGDADVFYRTGDIVQRLPDGGYRFLGRRDRQIKTRGYRVELDEIEAAFLSHPRVAQAAVYARLDEHGVNRIEAAVIVAPGPALQPSDLAIHVGRRLPAHAVPARIRLAEDLPRTSTGKIDRRALENSYREQGREPDGHQDGAA